MTDHPETSSDRPGRPNPSERSRLGHGRRITRLILVLLLVCPFLVLVPLLAATSDFQIRWAQLVGRSESVDATVEMHGDRVSGSRGCSTARLTYSWPTAGGPAYGTEIVCWDDLDDYPIGGQVTVQAVEGNDRVRSGSRASALGTAALVGAMALMAVAVIVVAAHRLVRWAGVYRRAPHSPAFEADVLSVVPSSGHGTRRAALEVRQGAGGRRHAVWMVAPVRRHDRETLHVGDRLVGHVTGRTCMRRRPSGPLLVQRIGDGRWFLLSAGGLRGVDDLSPTTRPADRHSERA